MSFGHALMFTYGVIGLIIAVIHIAEERQHCFVFGIPNRRKDEVLLFFVVVFLWLPMLTTRLIYRIKTAAKRMRGL